MIRNLVIILAIAASVSQAAVRNLEGSDTMAGAMRDAISAAHLTSELNYTGGGSGKGEAALVAGTQGIAAMSREISPAAAAQGQTKGVTFLSHVIAIDGVVLFVNERSSARQVTFADLSRIYSCTATQWEEIPQSGKTGAIVAYRRDDSSGTTDLVKNLLGLKEFGKCVMVVNDTVAISEHTSKEENAIGYAGLSAHVAGKNRPLSIARAAGEKAIAPSADTIRNRSYPLSRNLHVYEVAGSKQPSPAEAELMRFVTNRKQMDPIVEKHEFFTLP